jgi:hypothetical protein
MSFGFMMLNQLLFFLTKEKNLVYNLNEFIS